MPDELTREELLKKIRESRIINPEHQTFVNSIKELSEEMDRLMQVDENGWIMLGSRDKERLLEKYMQAGSSLEKFLETSKDLQIPEAESARKLARMTGELLSRDLPVIRQYNGSPRKSLETILGEARAVTVDLNGRQIKSVGGSLSERMPMNLMRPDGKTMKGVFTAYKTYDPERGLTKAVNDAAALAATPEGAQLLQNFYNQYKNYFRLNKNPDRPIYDDKDAAGNVVSFMGYLWSKDSPISKTKTVDALSLMNGISTKDVRKKIGTKALNKLAKGLANLETSEGLYINYQAGIPAKGRIDSRNSGMSTVADLLGMKGLLAKACPMNIRKPDGTIIQGTFMEKAKGEDAKAPSLNAAIVNANSYKNTNGYAFKQIADLQVLDYICGNIDRHGGNLFYQFDEKGKLIGIEGIDNDCSLGTVVPENNKDVNQMLALNNIKVISKSTADTILQMTPEMLKFSLRGQLEEEAIEGAVKRLNEMQKKIQMNRDLRSSKDKNIKPTMIEVEDKNWKKLKMENLAEGNNYFQKVKLNLEVMRLRASADHRGLQTTEVGTTDRATPSGLQNAIHQTNGVLKKLSDRTSFGRTSPNYEAVENAVKEYRELQKQIAARMKNCAEEIKKGKVTPETIYGQYVTQWDLDQMTVKLKNVKAAANTYLNGKADELNGAEPSSYTSKRMDQVREVREFAEKALEFSKDERKIVQENQRKATEQYVSFEKKNEMKQASSQEGGKKTTEEKEQNLQNGL